MPDLYRLHIGPVNAAYYQRQFQRFESAGKATPSWNNGAAFFTLAWLLLRKLWRPAGIYGAVLLAVLALWWWGIHGRVPLAMEGAVCVVAAWLLCVLPGFIGNGLYYHHVRKLTLQTLTSATSLGQARVQLATHAVTKERLQLVASIQALVALAVAFAVFFQSDADIVQHTSPASATVVASGPPDLVIPSVASIAPLELPPFTPDVTLPEATPPAATEPTPPAAELIEPPHTPAPPSQELSITTLAQSIPTAADTASTAAVKAVPAPPTAPAKTAVVPQATVRAAPTAAKSKPPVAVQPAAAPVSSVKPEGKYYLNAGVYAQPANVDAAVKKLKAGKLNPIVQTVSSKNGELTRLRIGPFDTRKQAEQAAVQARKLRIETTLIEPPKR